MNTTLIVIASIYSAAAAVAFIYCLFESGIWAEVFEAVIAVLLLVLVCAGWPFFLGDILGKRRESKNKEN